MCFTIRKERLYFLFSIMRSRERAEQKWQRTNQRTACAYAKTLRCKYSNIEFSNIYTNPQYTNDGNNTNKVCKKYNHKVYIQCPKHATKLQSTDYNICSRAKLHAELQQFVTNIEQRRDGEILSQTCIIKCHKMFAKPSRQEGYIRYQKLY